MIVTYGAVMLVIHHPVGHGGIGMFKLCIISSTAIHTRLRVIYFKMTIMLCASGEYPRNINTEVNLLHILKYAGVIGAIFTLAGYDDFKKRGMMVEGTQSYAIVLARVSTCVGY